MSSSTPVEVSPHRRSPRIEIAAWWAVPATLFVVGMLIVAPHVRGHSFVGRIDVRNSSEFAIEVEVAAPGQDGWLQLGTAVNRTSTGFLDVYDIGPGWTFRFVANGLHADQQFTRAQLQQQSWKVPVPAGLVGSLRAAGAPPAPVVANG